MEKLLFEIGTEEIPANFMHAALENLQLLAESKMKELRIPFTQVTVYGTPRRLAFVADGVAATQADSTVESKGPAIKIAFGADGAPSKAAQGFARGQGVAVEDLEQRDGYIYAVKHLAGQPVSGLLPAMLTDIIHALPFPKNMRWADYDFRFVRPIRWLVALLGSEVIPVEITDVHSGNKTRGHRFLSTGEVELKNAADYVQTLADNYVVVEQDKRKAMILQQVTELARSEGGVAEVIPDLLEEVTYLVEYPTAVCGHFEEKYLSLPKEAVITPMREHQRYFPVMDADGKLLAKFITVRNGGKEHLATVAHGNERVLRARLSDAEFFFDEDRKTSLADKREKLKKVSFQEGLGNVFDKTNRLVNLALTLKKEVALNVEDEELIRAAQLSKADLVTGMVTEFTELQGVMGREYALLDGEREDVALAIYEHYLPRFAGDVLPHSAMGCILSLADKVDNIAATFSRGMAPTGSQDPFGMRRQALGCINILVNAGYTGLYFNQIFEAALQLLAVDEKKIAGLVAQIVEFFKQRIKNMLTDQGIRYDVVDAVLSSSTTAGEELQLDVADIFAKAQVLAEYVVTAEAQESIQAFTRVDNISKKAEVLSPVINATLLKEQVEQDLYKAVTTVDKQAIALLKDSRYQEYMDLLNTLAAPVNAFFDGVMVMDKDENIKDNRLALLAQVRELANTVGDLSKIVM